MTIFWIRVFIYSLLPLLLAGVLVGALAVALTVFRPARRARG